MKRGFVPGGKARRRPVEGAWSGRRRSDTRCEASKRGGGVGHQEELGQSASAPRTGQPILDVPSDV